MSYDEAEFLLSSLAGAACPMTLHRGVGMCLSPPEEFESYRAEQPC